MSIRATSRPAPTNLPDTYICRRCGIRRGIGANRGRRLCRDCQEVLRYEGAA